LIRLRKSSQNAMYPPTSFDVASEPEPKQTWESNSPGKRSSSRRRDMYRRRVGGGGLCMWMLLCNPNRIVRF
jgi:hypothetical protein